MTRLAELVSIEHRSVRSVHLETDAGRADALAGYSVGAQVIDASRRITGGLQPGARNRAWSITGPYGVGKSSFAHFLTSLYGVPGNDAERAAHQALATVDAQLADLAARERERLAPAGLAAALVTADREPLRATLARAARSAAQTRTAKERRVIVQAADALATAAPGAAAAALTEVVDAMTAKGPVIFVIDELGKVLEHAAERPDEGDLMLLQLLAEHLSGSEATHGILLTLQHLAFEDYLGGVSEARRAEWRKVQGRLEDIAFLADREQAASLMAGIVDQSALPPRLRRAAARAEAATHSITATVAPAPYPVHPTVALALPHLAARFGQHNRSLVAFLTSDAPGALPAFLAAHHVGVKDIPFLRLHDAYDFLVASGSFDGAPPGDAGQLREVRRAVEGARDLEPELVRVAKTVALLNLLPARLGLAASEALVADAVAEPGRADVRSTLRALEERGIVTYRAFSDEYRIWSGSDFDIDTALAEAAQRLAGDERRLLADMARARPLRALVAARHTLQNHVLRFFEARYSLGLPAAPACSRPDPDGLALYVLADTAPPRRVPALADDGRPLVVAWSTHARDAEEASLQAAAVDEVRRTAAELEDDAVASRELRHRAEIARAALGERLASAFARDREGVHWFVGGREVSSLGPAELSRRISRLCDKRYPQAPVIRSEMLNRRELTSQGAKARRELITRMFANEREPLLGIRGSGPERALYDALLASTGIHHDGERGLEFSDPPADSSLAPAWAALMAFFDAAEAQPRSLEDLYAELQGPPYGMKAGPIPVLLAAALLRRSDDVFLYEEETFVPMVQAQHVERLLKDPNRFAVKRARVDGLRESVFTELEQILEGPALPSRTRNRTTLAIVRPLLDIARAWPAFTQRTARLEPRTAAVRDALLSANEPDSLLFDELPRACGLQRFGADAAPDRRRARTFSARLRAALAELGEAYPRLLFDIRALVSKAFETPHGRDARADLAARAAQLAGHVLEPRMRAFLALAAADEQDDDDWTEALVVNLITTPPSAFSDRDLEALEIALAERAAWFRRLETLRYGDRRGAELFETRRIAITAPDGRDLTDVVAFNDRETHLLDGALDEALRIAAEALGARGPRALLAVLGERLLTEEGATTGVDERTA